MAGGSPQRFRRGWLILPAAALTIAIGLGFVLSLPQREVLAGPHATPGTPEPSASPSAPRTPAATPTAAPVSPSELAPSTSAEPAPETSQSQTSGPAEEAPAVAPVITDRGAIEADTADRVIRSYIGGSTEISAADTDLNSQVGGVVAEAALAELENQRLELESNGWSLRGGPEVRSVEMIKENLAGDPPEVTVEACIDSSGVTTVDAAGEPVGSGPRAATAKHQYRLTQAADGAWRIVDHSFPDDPTC